MILNLQNRMKTDKEKLKDLFSTCSGPSMYPTLRTGDSIIIKQYKNNHEISIGDIIVYPSPKESESFDVVHRVIKLLSNGVMTRGDNNINNDPYIVKYEMIYGYVAFLRRKNKTKAVLNGSVGLLIHKIMLIRKFCSPFFLKPLQKFSRLVDSLKIFNFMHNALSLEKIAVCKQGKKEIILATKGKVIGRKKGNCDWQIKFPYKYFINKRKL